MGTLDFTTRLPVVRADQGPSCVKFDEVFDLLLPDIVDVVRKDAFEIRPLPDFIGEPPPATFNGAACLVRETFRIVLRFGHGQNTVGDRRRRHATHSHGTIARFDFRIAGLESRKNQTSASLCHDLRCGPRKLGEKMAAVPQVAGSPAWAMNS